MQPARGGSKFPGLAHSSQIDIFSSYCSEHQMLFVRPAHTDGFRCASEPSQVSWWPALPALCMASGLRQRLASFWEPWPLGRSRLPGLEQKPRPITLDSSCSFLPGHHQLPGLPSSDQLPRASGVPGFALMYVEVTVWERRPNCPPAWDGLGFQRPGGASAPALSFRPCGWAPCQV